MSFARSRTTCADRCDPTAIPLPRPQDYTGPRGYHEILQTVKPQGVHSEAFHCRTANTDALAGVSSLSEASPRTQAESPAHTPR
jgi:hypothetical protein